MSIQPTHPASFREHAWTLVLSLVCIGLLTSSLLPVSAVAQDEGPSQQDMAMHYSLYFENFRNENFQDAQKDLRWILEHAPQYPENDDRNYERAVELYAGLAKQAQDEAAQQAYIDTAATILRTATEKMNAAGLEYDPYAWEIEKGRFLQLNSSVLSESIEGLKTPADHYAKAFELAPDRIDPYYINQVIQNYGQNNKQQEALEFMDRVEAERGDDQDVQQILRNARSDIFGNNPDAQIDFLRSRLEKNPGDVELQKQLFTALRDQNYMDEASQLAEELLKSEGLSAETYRQIAEMQLNDGRPTQAFATYQKAIEAGAELKAEDYYNMGLAKRRSGDLTSARTYYRRAIEAKSDFGQAYIAIGDLYVAAVAECGGSKMSRRDKAVYWLALDMYQQAKRVDSSLSSLANNNINTYRQYMPSQEDIFYVDGWEVGEQVRIDYGCYSWINETTTVRQPS